MNPVQTLLTPALITSPQDMIVILVIALIVFGPKKLPEIGKQIGAAMRELNKMRGDVQKAFDLDEYTRFDSTLQYHSAPYGETYPITGTSTDSLPAYHADEPVHAGDHAMISAAAETDPHFGAVTYHDDPTHGSETAALTAAVTPARPTLTPPPGPLAARKRVLPEEHKEL